MAHRIPVIHVTEPAPEPDGTLRIPTGEGTSGGVAFNHTSSEPVTWRLNAMYDRGYSAEEIAEMIGHPQISAKSVGKWSGRHDRIPDALPVEIANAVLATPMPPWTEVVALREDLAAAIQKHRACKDVPVAEFFPERKGLRPSPRAVNACRSCPVQEACLEYTFSYGRALEEGYAAGYPPRKRQRLMSVYRTLGRDGFYDWKDRWGETEEFNRWITGEVPVERFPGRPR